MTSKNKHEANVVSTDSPEDTNRIFKNHLPIIFATISGAFVSVSILLISVYLCACRKWRRDKRNSPSEAYDQPQNAPISSLRRSYARRLVEDENIAATHTTLPRGSVLPNPLDLDSSSDDYKMVGFGNCSTGYTESVADGFDQQHRVLPGDVQIPEIKGSRQPLDANANFEPTSNEADTARFPSIEHWFVSEEVSGRSETVTALHLSKEKKRNHRGLPTIFLPPHDRNVSQDQLGQEEEKTPINTHVNWQQSDRKGITTAGRQARLKEGLLGNKRRYSGYRQASFRPRNSKNMGVLGNLRCTKNQRRKKETGLGWKKEARGASSNYGEKTPSSFDFQPWKSGRTAEESGGDCYRLSLISEYLKGEENTDFLCARDPEIYFRKPLPVTPSSRTY